jgi:hypothetical protein
MKKILPLIITLFYAICFLGCSDKVEITRTYTIFEPVFMSLQEIRSSVDVTEPKEINETGKIYLYKHYLFLNEPGKGIHVINNMNPTNPKAVKFISIPGNYDIAVKGDILYADSYIDLVVFDIKDMNNVTPIERLENMFNPHWYYIDVNQGLIVDWKEVKKVEVSEDDYGYFPSHFWYTGGNNWLAMSDARSFESIAPGGGSGVGGSMARFTIVNSFLFSVDHGALYAFNISNLKQPVLESTTQLGWGIETIFPYQNKLFLGTTTGMLIYDISAPASPQWLSTFAHVRSCDPVVVQDTVAFVTLRGGTECGGFTNQLDVINIKNPRAPYLVKSYPMVGPYGLGIDKSTLFVCDGSAGLKVYNVKDIMSIDSNMIKNYNKIDAYDVIPYNNLLILIGKDGLHQFDYSNPSNMIFLSKLEINKSN